MQIADSTLLPNEEETAGGSELIDVEERKNNFDDPNQLSTNLKKCLVSVLKIGLARMNNDAPKERMNMGYVTRELEHIRNAYIVGVHGKRHRTN